MKLKAGSLLQGASLPTSFIWWMVPFILMDSVTMLANLSLPTPGMKDLLLPAGLGVGRGEVEGPRQDSGLELCLMTLDLVTVRAGSATLELERRGL